ncbi:hypothetical protein GOP47_0008459 [Adiantum capillus-veneris]|uniref:Uncharacterized protein n=1 Tax=Adiantum capillus-veneris TaxID=13818 RepID=A0A9D4UYR1_ADICA|nr:hypothetical protein GOP47_0008459 [Adiantum capillus-veneris]
MSLREHWTVEPRIGDLYCTPIRYVKEGSQKDIEQVGCPYRENLHHLLADAPDSGNTKQMSTWMSYKRFLKKCEKKLAKVNLYTPDFPALEVVGKRLLWDSGTLFEEKAAVQDLECGPGHAEDLKTSDCGQDHPITGPRAELNTMELFLHGNPGDHVSSSVVLRNTGSTSLHFEWRWQPQLSLCNGQHEVDHAVEVPYFYIVPAAGILVPGESKDFYVEFRPEFPGTFIDSWNLVFSPRLSCPLQRLHLLGAATAPEDKNRKRQRELLQEILGIRQRTRGLEEIFCEIIENATKQVQVEFKKAPDFVSSEQFFDFMRELGSSPVDSFNADESEVKALCTWDSSVSNLMTRLDMVETDENWKGIMQRKASSLHLVAAIPAHPTAILNTAMYKTLMKIASQIEEIMEERESQNEVEQGSDSESITTFSLEDDSVKGPSNARSFGGSPTKQVLQNSNPTQDASWKGLGRRNSRPIVQNAIVGQVSSSKSMESSIPSKQVPANLTGSLKGISRGNSTKLVNASVNNGTPEQPLISVVVESVETCEALVRQQLQEGISGQFWNEVESSFTKLGPVVKRKIECCISDGDEDSACWLSLWFTRLSHVVAQ